MQRGGKAAVAVPATAIIPRVADAVTGRKAILEVR
jgi:hypothetical protein